MSRPAPDQRARLLAGDGQRSADSAILRLPGDALTVKVADVGPIPTPIRATVERFASLRSGIEKDRC